jgi:hypothetical protein
VKILRVRATQTETADGDPAAVPWWEMERTPTGNSAAATGSGTAPPPSPATGAATAPVTGSSGNGVLRAIGTGTASMASSATGSAGRALAARAAKPGSIVHAIAHCRPHSIATHHREIENLTLGRVAELQQHTLGKALKISGTALSALGDSVAAQWVAMGVAVYIVLSFVFLVL